MEVSVVINKTCYELTNSTLSYVTLNLKQSITKPTVNLPLKDAPFDSLFIFGGECP